MISSHRRTVARGVLAQTGLPLFGLEIIICLCLYAAASTACSTTPAESISVEEVFTAQHIISEEYVITVDSNELLLAAWRGVSAIASKHLDMQSYTMPMNESEFRTAFTQVSRECKACSVHELVVSAIEGMVRNLKDKHSAFVPAESWTSYETNSTVGLGFERVYDGFGQVVRRVPPKSPAEKAGLRPGDRIVQFEGNVTRQGGGSSVRLHEKKQVTLIIDRPNIGELRLKATPERLSTLSYQAMILPNKMAYIALPFFPSGDTRAEHGSFYADQLEQAFTKLQLMWPKGWILDLRGNTGGDAYQAALVAGYFGLRGNLATVDTRSGSFVIPVLSAPKTLGPVTVLIDLGTSSAAEVVAEALRQASIAHLIGTRTNGVGGTDLSVNPVAKGALFLSSGYVAVGEKRVAIGAEGVQPDETVILDRGALASGRDLQLEAAVAYIQRTAN